MPSEHYWKRVLFFHRDILLYRTVGTNHSQKAKAAITYLVTCLLISSLAFSGRELDMVNEPSCLPMCSLCGTTTPPTTVGFQKCGACKNRYYCGKKCQVQDWKEGGHKGLCGQTVQSPGRSSSHHPWCDYLHRNPLVDDTNLVVTANFNSSFERLVTTGMNSCMFIVVKTTTCIIGWHASILNFPGGSQQEQLFSIRKMFRNISMSDFVSGFVIPGEDRQEGSLDLKPTCRTMTEMPWTDPTKSRRLIMGFLDAFEWSNRMQFLPPVQSYKDFVVCDNLHKKPYTFSDVKMFDQGCDFDAGVDDPLVALLSGRMRL